MKKKFLGVILLFGIFSVVLFPSITQASLIPCGRNVDDAVTATNEMAPCTLCHFIVGFKGLIDFGMKIIVSLAIAAIFASGVMYILAFTDEGLVKTAKSMLTGTLVGFSFVILGWLIVNVTLWIIAPNIGVMTGKANWFDFSCDTTSSVVK